MAVSFSFFLGWLTVKTNSFWPAAMAHGALNSVGVGVAGNVQMAAPEIYRSLAHLGVVLLFGLVF